MAANSGCYLLAVVAEPISDEDKQIILQRLNKGLLSWDVNSTGCDLTGLENSCANVTDKKLDDCDVLIQYSTERLGVEVLVNPPVSTLKQCIRNLLTSTIEHKHIIHAGYTFTGSGSWILQDGAYSYKEFLSAFNDAQNRTTRTLHVHCEEEGDWNNFSKDVFTKVAKVSLNPPDTIDHLPGSDHLISCLDSVLKPLSLTEIMKASPLVGNIRFNRPTLYLFPAGQGDCALFGINGFNMLIDGGFNRKPCPWEFIRHLDRLDAILVTRLSESNLCSMSTLMKRKTLNSTYPQIGYIFCNIADGKNSSPTEETPKDKNNLLVSVVGEGHHFMHTLQNLNLVPHQCSRDIVTEPFVLYHKVGHGTLEMHVLCPPRDSKEMKDFLTEWSSYQEKFSCVKSGLKSQDAAAIPLSHATSVCAILVWRPSDPKDTITRILFPGSAPQNKIFEGLEKLKNLDILQHPTVSKASLRSFLVSKPKRHAQKAIPSRKSTASPILRMNGDITGPKKESKDLMKVTKEVKKIIKEVKKDVKSTKPTKDPKLQKEVKETKTDIKKEIKEAKPTAEKKSTVKATTKKETVLKSTIDAKTAPAVKKKVAKKEITTKPPKPTEAKKTSSSKIADSKTAKDVSNKKAAETKAEPKPKAKKTKAPLKSSSPLKTKIATAPKSPSKLSRAIATSGAVATAALTVGIAALLDDKKEEVEKEELIEVEIEDKVPLQNQSEGDVNLDEPIEIPASPIRQETMSPALSEPISLTASDTLSSAPMETVSPIPPPPGMMISPAEEKEVNEIKQYELENQTPDMEHSDVEIEPADTPVMCEDEIQNDLEEDEAVPKEDLSGAEDVTPEEEVIVPSKINNDLMTTSFIGESLDEIAPTTAHTVEDNRNVVMKPQEITSTQMHSEFDPDINYQANQFIEQKHMNRQDSDLDLGIEKDAPYLHDYQQEEEQNMIDNDAMKRSTLFEDGELDVTEPNKLRNEPSNLNEEIYEQKSVPPVEYSIRAEDRVLMEAESDKLHQEYEYLQEVQEKTHGSSKAFEYEEDNTKDAPLQLGGKNEQPLASSQEGNIIYTEDPSFEHPSETIESRRIDVNAQEVNQVGILSGDNYATSVTKELDSRQINTASEGFQDQAAYDHGIPEFLKNADESRESEDDVDLQRYMAKETPENLSTVSARDSDSEEENLQINPDDAGYDDSYDRGQNFEIDARKEDFMLEDYPVERKQAFNDEKEHDSAEEYDGEMICHPTEPGLEEFYMKVGPNVDDPMSDPIGQHYISIPHLRGKAAGEEPLYEEPEDSGSERSQSPVVEQPIFSSTNKADFPELVTVSGGTTPSEPDSPLDVKKGSLANLGVEVMDALSEHDLSEGSTHSPLVHDDLNTFESTEKDLHVATNSEFQNKTEFGESGPQNAIVEERSYVEAVADRDYTVDNSKTVSEALVYTQSVADTITQEEPQSMTEIPEFKEYTNQQFQKKDIDQQQEDSYYTHEQKVDVSQQEYCSYVPQSGFESDVSYNIPTGVQIYPEPDQMYGSSTEEAYIEGYTNTTYITNASEEYDFHSREQYGIETSVDTPNPEEYTAQDETEIQSNFDEVCRNLETQEIVPTSLMNYPGESQETPCGIQQYSTDIQSAIPAVSSITSDNDHIGNQTKVVPSGLNGDDPNLHKSYSNDFMETQYNSSYNASDSERKEPKMSGEQTCHVGESHYLTDSPEDNSMKNYSSPDITSPVDPELNQDPSNPFADRDYGNKYIPSRVDISADNNNGTSSPLIEKVGEYQDSKYPYSESSEDDDESTSLPGTVSPYAYTNKAYNQEEEDADGNHIYSSTPLTADHTTDLSRTSFDENNPPQVVERHTEPQFDASRNSAGFGDTTDAGYDFRLEEWGKPMGLPTPPEVASKVAKKPTKPVSSAGKAKSGEKRPSLENGKHPAVGVVSKATSSPAKKAKEPSHSSSPVYVDLAYVPHHGDPHYSDVEFFNKVRARYYVFSGINPSKEVLEALLEAKKTWNEDLEVTIIPTYETDTLGYWMAQNQEVLAQYSIEVAPSASRCTVNLQDHETSCAAYRLEF